MENILYILKVHLLLFQMKSKKTTMERKPMVVIVEKLGKNVLSKIDVKIKKTAAFIRRYW